MFGNALEQPAYGVIRTPRPDRPVGPARTKAPPQDTISLASLASDQESVEKLISPTGFPQASIPTNALEQMRQELRDICGSMATRGDHVNGRIENFERSVFERLQALETQFGDIFNSSAAQPQLVEASSAANAVHGGRSELGDSTSALTPESAHPTGTTTTPNEALSRNDAFGQMPGSAAKDKLSSIEVLDNAAEALETISCGMEEEQERVVELIVVKRSLSDELGMDVKHIDGHLSIIRIMDGGAVARANMDALHSLPIGDTLEVGDVIFRVNDITEPDSLMIQECQEKSLLRIHAVRL